MRNIINFDKEKTLGVTPTISSVFNVIDDELVLNCEWVANILNVHVRTVRRWVRDGKLEAYSAGGRYAIMGADLKSFLQRIKNRSKYVTMSVAR